MLPVHSSPLTLSVLLLASLTVLFVLAPRLASPNNSPSITDTDTDDDADDLALFRRATLDSSYHHRKVATPPKVAFLFLTNSDLIFAPLWEKYFSGNKHLINVYVHADPQAILTKPLTDSFRGRLISSKPTRRADPSLISAERRLLAAALVGDRANAYFALLSQHCIPLHSFPTLYKTLFPNPRRRRRRGDVSFIEILVDEPQMEERYVARGDDAMLPEVPFSRFRIGSQFFVLARRHAVLVVRDRRLWEKFRLPCLETARHSCYPEEHYFPTLLDMEDRKGCSGYTLTRVNWTGSLTGHPRMYAASEISKELIRKLRMSNSTYSYMFARKFEPDCLEPLMAIADDFIFRD